MKRTILFLSLLLTLFGIVSCDKRDAEHIPNILETYVEPKEDFYLIIEYSKDLDRSPQDMYVTVVSKSKLLSLKLNETEIPIRYFNYLDSSGAYLYDFDTYALEEDVIGDYDEYLSYQIILENQTIADSLLVPAEYSSELAEFDPNQDYTFTWSLGTNPKIQSIRLELETTNGDDFYYEKEINAGKRSYTFSKSLWDHMGTTELDSVEMLAGNYAHIQGGVVWLLSSGEHYVWNWDKSEQRHRERIMDLINNRISLPD
ncbi:MAG TPA: hypothetical protein PL020_04150 [Candidatus Cloacimonadota bacterium]|nr:hypothetical protein [Candidatus Cloacimonadota bacterium]